MQFKKIWRAWRRRAQIYEPLVIVEVSRRALLHNLQVYTEGAANRVVLPLLKSNAYGHGLVEVAHILEETNVPYLAVDSLYEAQVLRAEKISKPILIVGYTTPANILGCRLPNITFAILSLSQLRAISVNLKRPLAVHIKFDTGMHRHGLSLSELMEAIKLLKNEPRISVTGIFSHLADADSGLSEITRQQLIVWDKFYKIWVQEMGEPQWRHVAATYGVAINDNLNCNAVRVGLGLYGLAPSPFPPHTLQPVLRLKTSISTIREVNEGEYVGYNGTYRTQKRRLLATIPVGYYEGVDRRLSNKGFVLVHNIPCAIVGRISMNITIIDVTDLPVVNVGDEVVVISNQIADINSVQSWATEIGTINYDITVHIPSGIRREVIDN